MPGVTYDATTCILGGSGAWTRSGAGCSFAVWRVITAFCQVASTGAVGVSAKRDWIAAIRSVTRREVASIHHAKARKSPIRHRRRKAHGHRHHTRCHGDVVAHRGATPRRRSDVLC